jgi:hypothetical protein
MTLVMGDGNGEGEVMGCDYFRRRRGGGGLYVKKDRKLIMIKFRG